MEQAPQSLVLATLVHRFPRDCVLPVLGFKLLTCQPDFLAEHSPAAPIAEPTASQTQGPKLISTSKGPVKLVAAEPAVTSTSSTVPATQPRVPGCPASLYVLAGVLVSQVRTVSQSVSQLVYCTSLHNECRRAVSRLRGCCRTYRPQ
jgi:hypothetical protein